MAENDDAVYDLGNAYILLAEVGAADPTAAAVAAFDPGGTPPTGFSSAGHTSLDNDFAPFFDGGEATTRGTRQNANLRTQVAVSTEGMEVSRVQVDTETLQSYYGGGTAPSDGRYDAPDSATPIEKAVLIVYLDGARRVAEYHPKASIVRSGPVRNAKGGWLEFPVRMTWLKVTGKPITSWFGDEILDSTP